MSVLADALQAAQARAAAAVGKAFVAGRITRDQADTELAQAGCSDETDRVALLDALVCPFWGCGEPSPCPFHEVRHEQVRKDERVFFVCPACGGSFEVRSETSTRIFCSRACRGNGRTL